jgi:hypothetical protein
MNWKGYGRKQSWSNLRYYPSILPRGTKENHKKSVCIVSLWAKIFAWDLLNMKQVHIYGGDDKCIHFNLETEGKRPHGNIGIDGKIILKCI